MVQEPDQVQVQAHRKPLGYVHFRVIIPVTVQERRERGDRVPIVHQCSDNATHKVPVAPAAHRLHGQYPRASRGNGPRPHCQREHHHRGSPRYHRHFGEHRSYSSTNHITWARDDDFRREIKKENRKSRRGKYNRIFRRDR